MKNILSIVLLAVILSRVVQAAPICNTLQECQTVQGRLQSEIDQVAAKIRELAPPSQFKVASTGILFTRVTGKPQLGLAYKVRSLIWGDILRRNGDILKVNQFEADELCKAVGARLPTKEEFVQLAADLGYPTANGYQPMLPNLEGNEFWSSSISPYGTDTVYTFSGHYGELSYLWTYMNNISVRCVRAR